MVAAKHPHVTPLPVVRGLRVLGTHVSNWRKLNRLTAAMVAERAGISRDTLRAIEQGKGTASTENLLRVLRIIGIMDAEVALTRLNAQATALMAVLLEPGRLRLTKGSSS